ncbi:MAG TPA: hypothetical protein PKE69_12025 [Pyrinomonadaceae bacterium]|nr:hypothetical protein [Pyrinomonadaceae bacterium]
MCHFITATLPKDADLKKSQEIFKQHHLRFEQIENQSVREHLEKGDIYILTTQGMCDCGTVLASQNRDDYALDEISFQKATDAAIKKLKAKGWSDAKILRWQKETELNDERNKMEKEKSHEYLTTRADDWANFIKNLLNSKSTKRIGILVHEYSSGIENRIKILRKETISIKKLTPKFLVEMSEDVIYDFIL